MKTKLSLMTIFFITYSTVILAQLPTLGLLREYSFSGNVNDSSGNNQHGTVTGATLTTDRFGNTNAAYNFNGTNAYIEIPTNGLINNSYTYSMWVNPSSIPGAGLYTYPFAIGNPGGGQNVALTNNQMQGWSGGAYNNSTPTLSLVAVGVLPNVNEWAHVVYLRDNSSIVLYVNGVLNTNLSTYSGYNSNTGTTTPNYGSSPKALIGCRDYLSQFFFDGKIDDLRIYNRALNQTEINDLYNENVVGINDMKNNGLLKIFPNPANDKLIVNVNKNGNSNIVITDILGKKIKHIKTTELQIEINISDLQSGVYFIRLTQENVNSVQKIVIRR